jgi:hypothetical protein
MGLEYLFQCQMEKEKSVTDFTQPDELLRYLEIFFCSALPMRDMFINIDHLNPY